MCFVGVYSSGVMSTNRKLGTEDGYNATWVIVHASLRSKQPRLAELNYANNIHRPSDQRGIMEETVSNETQSDKVPLPYYFFTQFLSSRPPSWFQCPAESFSLFVYDYNMRKATFLAYRHRFSFLKKHSSCTFTMKYVISKQINLNVLLRQAYRT